MYLDKKFQKNRLSEVVSEEFCYQLGWYENFYR